MFPFRDHNPSGCTPYVTYALIAANVLIFLATLGLGDGYQLASFYDTWALVPAEATQGVELYTFISSMFLHGGFMHLAGNMLFLWIFGDNMEDAFGPVKFLLFYLACGIGADFFHIATNPASQIPLIGASGAIAGVLGGYLLLYPKAKVDIMLILIVFFKRFTLPAWIVLSIWFGIQIFSGAATASGGGGVAYWAHVGGFLCGIALALPYWFGKGATAFWVKTEGHPPHPETDVPTHKTSIPTVRRNR